MTSDGAVRQQRRGGKAVAAATDDRRGCCLLAARPGMTPPLVPSRRGGAAECGGGRAIARDARSDGLSRAKPAANENFKFSIQNLCRSAHSFNFERAASEQPPRESRWAQDARINRRQRRWRDATRPGCIFESASQNSPRERHGRGKAAFSPPADLGDHTREPRLGPR